MTKTVSQRVGAKISGVYKISRYSAEKKTEPTYSKKTLDAIADADSGENLYGPFKTAKEAIAAMLED